MMTEMAPYLTLNVPPDEMVKYIQDLMTLPHGEIAAGSAMALAQRHWGGDTPLARAALLRWGALNRTLQAGEGGAAAFGRVRGIAFARCVTGGEAAVLGSGAALRAGTSHRGANTRVVQRFERIAHLS